MAGIGKVYDTLINGLAALAGAIVAAMVALIVVDVALRNLGFEPPAATVALTEYALLYFTMAAAPWLTRQKGHVTVLIVLDRLSLESRKRAAAAVALACAAISFAIAGLSGVLMIESLVLGDVEPRSIDLPRWLLFLPLVVGMFFTGTEFVRFVLLGDDVTVSSPEKI
ncbi:MAG: TRAP transporter small permease subunit [Alphaproteobacteria bacterium]|nr:TRAP transporter small permease subunit [Alphaproteobacteria bacterium]